MKQGSGLDRIVAFSVEHELCTSRAGAHISMQETEIAPDVFQITARCPGCSASLSVDWSGDENAAHLVEIGATLGEDIGAESADAIDALDALLGTDEGDSEVSGTRRRFAKAESVA
jgi:hypothetical protein